MYDRSLSTPPATSHQPNPQPDAQVTADTFGAPERNQCALPDASSTAASLSPNSFAKEGTVTSAGTTVPTIGCTEASSRSGAIQPAGRPSPSTQSLAALKAAPPKRSAAPFAEKSDRDKVLQVYPDAYFDGDSVCSDRSGWGRWLGGSWSTAWDAVCPEEMEAAEEVLRFYPKAYVSAAGIVSSIALPVHQRFVLGESWKEALAWIEKYDLAVMVAEMYSLIAAAHDTSIAAEARQLLMSLGVRQ